MFDTLSTNTTIFKISTESHLPQFVPKKANIRAAEYQKKLLSKKIIIAKITFSRFIFATKILTKLNQIWHRSCLTPDLLTQLFSRFQLNLISRNLFPKKPTSVRQNIQKNRHRKNQLFTIYFGNEEIDQIKQNLAQIMFNTWSTNPIIFKISTESNLPQFVSKKANFRAAEYPKKISFQKSLFRDLFWQRRYRLIYTKFGTHNVWHLLYQHNYFQDFNWIPSPAICSQKSQHPSGRISKKLLSKKIIIAKFNFSRFILATKILTKTHQIWHRSCLTPYLLTQLFSRFQLNPISRNFLPKKAYFTEYPKMTING